MSRGPSAIAELLVNLSDAVLVQYMIWLCVLLSVHHKLQFCRTGWMDHAQFWLIMGATFWLGLSYKLLNGYLDKVFLWQFVQKSRFRRKILLQPINHQVLSTQFDWPPLPDYYTEHLLLSATGCMWYGASQWLSTSAEACSLNWSCTICSRPLLELVTFACVWFQTTEAV